MSLEKKVWIVAEKREGKLDEISIELLGEGRRITNKLGGEVCALLMGKQDTNFLDLLAQHGADKVYLLNSPQLESYSPELYTQAVSGAIKSYEPDVVLCGATLIGKDLAPRLAARLRTGLVSDCIRLRVDSEGQLVYTKPTYAGKVDSIIIYPTARPQIATLRSGMGETKRPDPSRKAEVITLSPQLEKTAFINIVGFLKADPKTLSLEEAEIIIAGGKGVGSAENFRLLEELAEAVGGTVAGSRIAVDEGWLPSHKLVGQSGKTVAPKLYIACGISGASQHTLAMKDSDIIVVINTDRQAPIFKLADVGIVGDLREVVPALTSQVRQMVRSSQRSNEGLP